VLGQSVEFSDAEVQIIKYGMATLTVALLEQSAKVVEEFLQVNQALLLSQLCSGANAVMSIIRQTLSALFLVTSSCMKSDFLARQLICCMQAHLRSESPLSHQFFSLFCLVIEKSAELFPARTAALMDETQLQDVLLAALENHCSEEEWIYPEHDQKLIGLLKLANAFFARGLIRVSSEERIRLAKRLLLNDLFMPETIKCISNESRKCAFSLVLALAQDHAVTRELIEVEFKEIFRVCKNLSLSPNISNELVSRLRYVGVRNLGCICYMNAMIQQFFMTPTFRHAILMADEQAPEGQ